MRMRRPAYNSDRATRAAPSSAVFGFSATSTGIVSISDDSRPLSRKALTNAPALGTC